ncbi:MAG: DUF3147 family protein [Silvibacterium sp.]
MRFIFGGVCIVTAGILARRFGPEIGGLFLAFPAIFSASASLIEKHEQQQKQRIVYDGTNRGRTASSIDAAGASLGCLRLAAFALVIWRTLPQRDPWFAILMGSVVWIGVSFSLWLIRKSRFVRLIARSCRRVDIRPV